MSESSLQSREIFKFKKAMCRDSEVHQTDLERDIYLNQPHAQQISTHPVWQAPNTGLHRLHPTISEDSSSNALSSIPNQLAVLIPSGFIPSFNTHVMSLLHVCKHSQACPTLCNPTNCSPPGSSVLGIIQVRIIQSVAIFYSRGSSQSRDQIHVSCISCTGRILYHCATWEAPCSIRCGQNFIP